LIDDVAEFDLIQLQPLIGKYQHEKRDALIPFLQDAQAIFGWLPEQVQEAVGNTLRVPLADIHGVIEFYSMLYNQPTSRKIIRVCHDPVCWLSGADSIARAITEHLEKLDIEDERKGLMLEKVSCLGMCEHAPAALIGEVPTGELTSDSAISILDSGPSIPPVKVFGDQLLILDKVGKIDPGSLQDYEARDGYVALKKAISYSPVDLIDQVLNTGMLGRGGAMFPVGRKWLFTRDAKSEAMEKYVVVNGDESEPGAFKDRVLMEEDPFAIVEAATIAGYAIGAQKGWIFVRGEYPLAAKRLDSALKQARDGGYLGRNILGMDDFNFDIEIRQGAGAYICGEETALFEAIEGKRGFPRKKPPYPVTHGLFQRPTAVNNVETLAALVAALRIGIDEWKSFGTEQSPGTKLFCLSGHVKRPGVYETPFGLTVEEMISLAGGTVSGGTVEAVLVGGAAGVFIGPEKLDMPLTYEDSRQYGVPIGSGALMVFEESTDMRQILYQISRFFAHESCGKCYPCQLGTQRQMEILGSGVDSDTLSASDTISLEDIGFAMTQTSLCGLGQTAATAIKSALELWPELYA
jgi:NADH-quinone oxidoreductase subunit F